MQVDSVVLSGKAAAAAPLQCNSRLVTGCRSVPRLRHAQVNEDRCEAICSQEAPRFR